MYQSDSGRQLDEQPLSPRKTVLQKGEGEDVRYYPVDEQGEFLYPEDAAIDLAENEKFSYVETFKRRANCCSLSSYIIYFQFLVVPFVVTFLWVLIPSLDFFSFSALSGSYFLYSFLIWQSFFDMILPGCDLILFILFDVIFVVGMSAIYAAIYFGDIYTEKLAYLSIGAYGVACNLLCFAIHILKSRVFTRSAYRPAPLDSHKIISGDGEETGRETVKLNADALKSYTAEMEAEAGKQRGVTFDDNLRRYETEDVHISKYFYNYFCFVKRIDWNIKKESSAFGVKLEWSVLAWGFVFRVAIFGVWLYLQFFTEFLLKIDAFKNKATTFIMLILFQLSKIIIFQIMLSLNEKLPKMKEIKYFATFAVPMLLLMFYRNLFLNVSQWWMVICISIIVFVWQILFYPLQMTYWFYKLRFVRFREWLLSKDSWLLNKLANGVAPTAITYKKYVTQLAVEYYYEEIATYISIIAILIFFPGARYSYNHKSYPSIDALDDDEFYQLWLRYLYFFVAEAVGDFIIRAIIHFGLKVDPTSLGKSLTVMNYRTRFLFGIFVVYLMTSTYYSLIRLENFS